MKLILASTSETRKAVLRRAGIQFSTARPQVDEESLKAALAPQGIDKLALHLAAAKARSLSAGDQALVLGADQTLLFSGQVYNKPGTLDEARNQLRELRGRSHTLQSALAVARSDEIIWTHVSEARLTMRHMSDAYIEDYLASEGEACLHSVGCYRIEERGSQLFELIDGDFFVILGMPLLPLLQLLREQGMVAT